MNENYKVLLVDDEPDVREIYQIFLTELLGKEFELNFFSNGKECMSYMHEYCKENERVFIVTDINMPVMDGFTLLQKIGSKYRSAEVALCSAYDTSDYRNRCKDLGAVGFISKPVDFQEMASLISERMILK